MAKHSPSCHPSQKSHLLWSMNAPSPLWCLDPDHILPYIPSLSHCQATQSGNQRDSEREPVNKKPYPSHRACCCSHKLQTPAIWGWTSRASLTEVRNRKGTESGLVWSHPRSPCGLSVDDHPHTSESHHQSLSHCPLSSFQMHFCCCLENHFTGDLVFYDILLLKDKTRN